MAAKVQETENKKASKARIREGEQGQWWPCETTDTELREIQNEGMISAHWSFIRDTVVPKPGAGEVVMTKAWVERGLSLPCSEFFLSILNTYGLQPHNICPNSYLLLSNFATLCEGHLGIRLDVKLWHFFFRVKKETKDKAMLNCGSMTFMLRPGRMYPPHDSHESVRYWNAGWFYEKNVSVPEIHDGLPKFNNEPPEELASWSFIPSLSLTPILEKAARRISWLVHDGLTGTQLTLAGSPGGSSHYEENLRAVLHVPVSGDTAEEVPDDEEEEEEQAPRKAAPRPSKCPRAKAPSSEAGASGEASAKKPKTIKPPPLESRKAERERLKMLSTPSSPAPRNSAKHFPPPSPPQRNNLPSCRKHSTGSNSGQQQRWAEKILRPKALPEKKQKFKAKERLRYRCAARRRSGYDTRIARRIRHEEFYDKFTWTSSKDAPQEEPKSSAATSEEEDSEEDVLSPAEDAKEKNPEGKASPSKAE
ncbi:hypothetical protein QYE76_056525 [Lolium multiflorum]|uniref:Transposase (putative) gypsy type domain-containing protein n=1 Tax=Lolium multiflorum TaxID=4521 RepID=A0AAD8WN91_LOLMU|nr:hypothetical protein QYE76_056525 [Lolium multiflorum]